MTELMPTQKTLREIIEEVYDRGFILGVKDGIEPKKVVDSAISEIKSLLKEELPKKKDGVIAILDKDGNRYYKEEDLPKGAYNECRAEIEKIVEEL